MAQVILSYWQGKLIDNRKVPDEAIQDKFTLPKHIDASEKLRALVGWDGFFIFDRRTPVLDMVREYVHRIQKGSCGACTPCRVGTKLVEDKLTSLAEGLGRAEDLAEIKQLAEVIRASSMCEWGHTSMNALLKIMELMPDIFQNALRERRPAARGYYYSIQTAPCIEACPAHLDIPSYIDSIRSGNYRDSLAIIQQKNPLPGICGRVCVRPCEFACRREELDDPIAIKYLKRFANDQIQSYVVMRERKATPPPLTSDKKVAVVGAGPCGMTAAFFLRQKGYHVEIFEDLFEPGGMSAVGIPDYRLPRSVISAEAKQIEDTGVKFTYGVRIGRDKSLKQLRSEFDAVFIAIGAHGGKKVGMAGEELKPVGLIPGVTFLRQVSLLQAKGEYERPEGKHVVVIGGGNVAMDCARTARRLGYEKVSVVYRRTVKEMPADAVEIREAHEEGVEFLELTHPSKIETEDRKITGLTCVRMELSEPDASGRRKPVEAKGSEFLLKCEVVIPAIGQATEMAMFTDDFPVKISKWGTVEVNEETLMSSQDGVFAGGDCASGPKALIDAMRQGTHAAHCIDLYLRGQKMEEPKNYRAFRVLKSLKLPAVPVDRIGRNPQVHPQLRSAEERIGDFQEIESGFTPEQAVAEAERCMRCYRLAMLVTEA